ncbi:MAB_1171c family putative transporter [Streptomyces asiaticus]
MSNAIYWILAGSTWTAFFFKAPGLRLSARNPLYLSVCGVLLLSGATYLCSNPSFVSAMDELIGVTNLTLLLDRAMLTAISAIILTLIMYWRGGPKNAVAARIARWLLTTYATIVGAEVILFVLGNTSVETPLEFDTYYANTPYIRWMIALYLLAHGIAAIIATALCWRWSAGITEPLWLRRGLRVLTCGFLLNICFDITKITAVGARWNGTNWDFMNTTGAPVCATLCTTATTIGFILPLVGDRISAARADLTTYRELLPLWKALREATPDIAAPVPIHWWNLDLRLTRRITEIHDGRLALRAYHDPAVAADASRQAQAADLATDEANAVVEAAVLASAIRRKATSLQAPPVTTGPTTTATEFPLPRVALVQISRALQHSPIIAAACMRAPHQEISTHGPANQ